MDFTLLVLLALCIPLAGIAGLVIALSLRGRTAHLERRLADLEARLARLTAPGTAQPLAQAPREAASPPPAPAPAPATETAAPPPPAPKTAVPEVPPAPAPAARPTTPPGLTPASPAPPRPGLEEALGARWAVWVGGVALALGGVFLVRYSIEQGLLGPAARVAAGALFALALMAGGEALRRRDRATGFGGFGNAQISGVLTGAGVTSAFATAYAAHALYDLIGAGLAFLLLGAIGIAAMLAAALHGPALAGLGLVGALGSPLLVESDEPRYWPLVLYLAVVAGAAYGLARLRLWPWLARAAAIGGVLWGLALLDGGAAPAMAHALVQAAMAALFLLVLPYAGIPEAEQRPDRLGGGALLAFAILGVVVVAEATGGGRLAFAGALAALLVATALRVPAGAPAAAWAALVGVGTLAVWPIRREVAQEADLVIPQVLGPQPQPEALGVFLAFAAAAAAIAGLPGLWRLLRAWRLPLSTAAWFAGAATLGPLAVLVLAWARVSALDASLPFAAIAGLLAAGFTAAAREFRRREADALDGVRLATGAAASAAVAALALGLTFALDRSALTVALALAALGTAYVADRTGIAPLRWAVGAAGIVVLGRLVWHPTLGGMEIGPTPILNGLLWTYGAPAAAFLAAGRLLEHTRRDWIARLAESLALVFGALLAFLQIRHAATGGDLAAPVAGHLEAGLMVTASLAFSLLMVRVDAARPDSVSRVAGLVFGALALGGAALFLGVVENPFLLGDRVAGGPVVNSLLAAYALPAGLAAALAVAARGVRPRWYVASAGALSLGLALAYLALAIRRIFQGPDIGFFRPTGQGEMWAYSVGLLALGAALLAVGLWRDWRGARLASGLVIAAAVVKVFLVDLAHLEGAMRAFSLIGLGLALVAIGLAYQRLLARPAVGGATQ